MEIAHIGSEMAVALFLGCRWQQDRGFNDGDVRKGIEVRWTHNPQGRLLLHQSDNDESVFFFVTGEFPLYSIRGYCWGKEGKVKDFWKELQPGRPCFAIPANYLRDVSIWQNYVADERAKLRPNFRENTGVECQLEPWQDLTGKPLTVPASVDLLGRNLPV